MFWPANAIIARIIAKRLERYRFQRRPKVNFTTIKRQFGSSKFNLTEVKYMRQEIDAAFLEEMFSQKGSPVIYTGDSQSYSPTIASSLRAFLALESGVIPESVYTVGSSGSSKLRDMFKLPDDFWSNRQVCIVMITGDIFAVKWLEKDLEAARLFRGGELVLRLAPENNFAGLELLPGTVNLTEVRNARGIAAKALSRTVYKQRFRLPSPIGDNDKYLIKLEAGLDEPGQIPFFVYSGKKLVASDLLQGESNQVYASLDVKALKYNPYVEIRSSTDLGKLNGGIQSIEIRRISSKKE